MIKIWPCCFSLLFLVFSIFGCKVESQRARDSFVDKKLPELLNRFANQQFHEKLNRQKIVERLKRDQHKSRQLLRIAAIDNGTDPFHPDLIDQIDFNLDKKGRLRMGKDIMGQDYFASPNLIDPSLFAFGAKLQGSLIEQYVENPLDLMKKMNDRFLNVLITEMNSNPQFEETLFRDKFTRDSMNIFGAYRVFLMFSDEFKYQEMKEKKNKEKKNILIKSKRNYAVKDKESGEYLYSAKKIHNVYDRPWFVNSKTGLVAFDSYRQDVSDLMSIEKGFEFLELIFKSFKKVNSELKVIDSVNSYKEFLEKRQALGGSNNNQRLDESIDNLSRALYYKNYGVNSFHPIRDWVVKVYDSLISNPEKDQRILTKKFTVKPNEFFKMVEHGFKKSQEVYQFLEKNVDSLEERIEAKLTVEQLKVIAELFKDYRKSAKFNLVDLLSPHATVSFSSESRGQQFFTYHPYISESSSKESHGTHVALTGSVQNKNLRVFPIRVTTSSVYLNSEQQEEIKSIFKGDFKKWLETPLVIKALKGSFGDVIDFSSKSHGVESLMNFINTTIDLFFEKEAVEYIVVLELIEAIKEIGKQKIKLANISLGTSFSSHVPSQFEESVEKRVINSYKFLLFEYFKFRIGEAILKHAQQALFIVAAGNEGNWVDGRSRSALPGDISSLWLGKHETSKRYVAPNNRVNNILTVGSLDRKGEMLSSFTNIPVDTRNLIFARGETVLAAGGAYDSSAVEHIMKNALPGFANRVRFVYLESDLIKQFLVEKGYLTNQEVSDFKKFSRKKRLLEGYISNNYNILEVQIMHLFNKYRPNTISMTGTSMAAPSVWGYIANFVQKEMVKRGLSSEEIWSHRDFSPGELMREVKSRTVGLEGHSKSPYRLLPEKKINRVQRDKGGRAIMKYIQIQQKNARSVSEISFTSASKRTVITCKSFL